MCACMYVPRTDARLYVDVCVHVRTTDGRTHERTNSPVSQSFDNTATFARLPARRKKRTHERSERETRGVDRRRAPSLAMQPRHLLAFAFVFAFAARRRRLVRRPCPASTDASLPRSVRCLDEDAIAREAVRPAAEEKEERASEREGSREGDGRTSERASASC